MLKYAFFVDSACPLPFSVIVFSGILPSFAIFVRISRILALFLSYSILYLSQQSLKKLWPVREFAAKSHEAEFQLKFGPKGRLVGLTSP